MAVSVGSTLAGYALIALVAIVGVSAAHAATGRITFSGAIVEPTCSDEGVSTAIAHQPVDGFATARVTCGRTAADPGRSYVREVSHVTTVDRAHNPLLAYFASYAKVGGRGEVGAKIVVHTYD